MQHTIIKIFFQYFAATCILTLKVHVAVNESTEDTSATSEPAPIREHTHVETPSDPSTFNKEPAACITATQSPFSEVIQPTATQST